MRVLLIAVGSRGDVQPLVALGIGLRDAGHEVTLCSTPDFGNMVSGHGLGFAAIGISATEVMDSEFGRTWLGHSSHNPFVELHRFREIVKTWGVLIADDLAALVGRHDLIVSGLLTATAAQALAESSGARHAIALLAPYEPTRAGWASLQPAAPEAWSRRNLASGSFGAWFLAGVVRLPGVRVRELLGLPREGRRRVRRLFRETPTLLGFSPAVVPPPADWPAGHTATGYWVLDSGSWRDPDLEEFLDAGEPPVYVGFGSMSAHDADDTVAAVVTALARTGRRGLISSGGAGLGGRSLPDDVRVVGSVPHDRLFPRCAAVIHHGGAGTTAAALLAGVPQGVVAHIGDQPLWGRRVAELGVAAAPIRRHQLTADSLTAMITEATDPARAGRAAALGEQLRAEDGVARAVAQLTETVA